MRSPANALRVAKHLSEIHYKFRPGFCLGAVRQYFDAPYAYATAAQNWYRTPDKFCHYDAKAPAGYPLSWLGGQHGAGHIAISDGNGWCYSTDFGPRGYIGDGRVRRIPTASISKYDHYLRFRGWATWLEGVKLPNA